jgi:hypothetical protein
MRFTFPILFLWLVTSFTSNFSLSQSVVKGEVIDCFTGQAISGTKVYLTQDGTIIDQFISGPKGEYRLTAPKNETYLIEVNAEGQGYAPIQMEVLTDRDTNTLDSIYLGANTKEFDVIIIQQKRKPEPSLSEHKVTNPFVCNWPPDNYDNSYEPFSRREKRKQKRNYRRSRK